MFGTLPDLTPRNSHSLWYSSSRSPVPPLSLPDAPPTEHNGNGHNNSNAHQRRLNLERTALHRLAMDEIYSARRKVNVANFGSHWLKPPGVAKTLHQMREEKREQEEHAEQLRREQLQQELQEAGEEGMPGGGEMDDVQLDGAQDLDADIPDAADDFMMGSDDEDEDEEEDEEEEEEDGDEGEAEGGSDEDQEAIREGRQNDLVAARMHMNHDRYREALARGDPDGEDMYGGDEELQEEGEGHMLDEADFADDGLVDGEGDMGDMDADLDDDIPEADSEVYEHTDSEAELSSSEVSAQEFNSDDEGHAENDEEDEDEEAEDAGDGGFAPRAMRLGPALSPTLRGRESLPHPRHSMELSSLLDESSYMASSPAQARRARYG